jgi:hypothetical protein
LEGSLLLSPSPWHRGRSFCRVFTVWAAHTAPAGGLPARHCPLRPPPALAPTTRLGVGCAA